MEGFEELEASTLPSVVTWRCDSLNGHLCLPWRAESGLLSSCPCCRCDVSEGEVASPVAAPQWLHVGYCPMLGARQKKWCFCVRQGWVVFYGVDMF